MQDRATWRDQAEGPLQHTGNPLDLAIGGEGFFTVDTPRGPRLTRAGRFTAQGDGTISDTQGNALLDTAGQKLRISPADINLTVTADGAISSENGTIGRIGVVQPADLAKLQGEGGTAAEGRHANQLRSRSRRSCRAPSRTATSSRSWK